MWLLHISRPEMQIAIMCTPSIVGVQILSAVYHRGPAHDQELGRARNRLRHGGHGWWRGRRQCSFPAASLTSGAGVFLRSLCLPHTSAMLSRSKLQPLGAAAHRREKFRWSWSGPDHSAAAYNTLADTLSRTTSPSSINQHQITPYDGLNC